MLLQGIETLFAVCAQVLLSAVPNQFDAIAGVEVRHPQGHYTRRAQVALTFEDAIADVLVPGEQPSRRVELEKTRRSAAMRNIGLALWA